MRTPCGPAQGSGGSEFNAPEAVEVYRKASGILNVDPSTRSGDWPPPLLHHVAGEPGDKLVVVEVWESKAAQEEFMEKDLALAFTIYNSSTL